MRVHDDALVRVQRDWKGWRTAWVRLQDVHNFHWFQPSGAPRRLAHGYVSCASIVSGDISHECERSTAPHHLLVCILKSHTAASIYAEIARRADECRELWARGQPAL